MAGERGSRTAARRPRLRRWGSRFSDGAAGHWRFKRRARSPSENGGAPSSLRPGRAPCHTTHILSEQRASAGAGSMPAAAEFFPVPDRKQGTLTRALPGTPMLRRAMATSCDKPYPGELATPFQVRLLAQEYQRAAHALQQLGRRGEPLSRAPYRLSAIHSIEPYLNALLLAQGQEPTKIRGLQHDLATRTDLAIASGLKLRKRTAAHLRSVAETREYLVTRYGPEMSGTASQINRLTATLDEVAKKVTLLVPNSM